MIQNRAFAFPLATQYDLRSNDPFYEATEGLVLLSKDLRELLQVILALAAILILVRIIFKLMGGDKESAKNLLWWLIGLVFGFTMLEIF